MKKVGIIFIEKFKEENVFYFRLVFGWSIVKRKIEWSLLLSKRIVDF